MKSFDCGSLVPGCTFHTEAENEAEVVRREVEHLKSAHGETVIRPDMIEHIKERIVEAAPAHH